MNFDSTLTRYLRNFDPINESLFNVPGEDEPRDNVITEHDLDHTDEAAEKLSRQSQKSKRSCMSPQSKDIHQVVKQLKER